MPNHNYERSVRRERDIVNEFRHQGADACRSAGSHSPWDVWSWDKVRKRITLIQVKTKKGGKRCKVKDLTSTQGVEVITKTLSYE